MKLHSFTIPILLLYVFIIITERSECTSLGERIGRRVTLSWHPHAPPPSSTDHDHNNGKKFPVESNDSSCCGAYDWMEKRNGDRKGRQMLNGGFQRSYASPPEAPNRVIGQDEMQRYYSSPPLQSMDDSCVRGVKPTMTR